MQWAADEPPGTRLSVNGHPDLGALDTSQVGKFRRNRLVAIIGVRKVLLSKIPYSYCKVYPKLARHVNAVHVSYSMQY